MAVFMSMTRKKLAVLDALAEVAGPIGLPALMQQLPGDFTERSVRRWLADLADEGQVLKTGRKRGTRYQIATAFRSPDFAVREVRDESESAFGGDAQRAIHYVRQPLFKRKPVTYNQGWFDDYDPNRSGYFTSSDIEILAAQGRRSSGQEPAGTYARRIYNRLLIDLSYNSSRLEGNTYSLVDTQRLVLEGAGVEGKLDEEKIMILNHKEAIRHLVDGAPRLEASYDELCTLHYLLSDGLVPAHYSGKVRDHGVRVGASSYIPLEGPTALDRQLHAIATKAAAIENPYEQSLFALIHVAYLQAFTDVNKRTSRLAANIPLVKNNLVPLSFNSIGKDDYASAMIAIYELNDPRPLIELYRSSYLRGCQEYDATAEALGFDDVRVRYRPQRRQLIRELIAGLITGEAMTAHITRETARMIPAAHRHAFIEDVREDLTEIAPQRIAGLGITRQQLERWLQHRPRGS